MKFGAIFKKGGQYGRFPIHAYVIGKDKTLCGWPKGQFDIDDSEQNGGEPTCLSCRRIYRRILDAQWN
ncbi:MAG: hypothetical protein ABSB40_07795 [Nitrososphaeria archaeon]|jgi:hypothetical protein